ncbi:MAG: glycosyltransferase family 4 protein [Psychrobium sp.]|nr:glycosyltransferase family 4 protein [Psychrobium sp.]
MKVLFVAPSYINLDSSSGGVFNEMKARELALNTAGIEVNYLALGEAPDWDNIDLCHLFMANEGSYGLSLKLKEKKPLIVSPIIDRTQSNFFLKASIFFMGKIPSMSSNLLKSKAICKMADGILVRSSEEEQRILAAYNLLKKTKVVKIPFQFEPSFNEKKKKQVFFLGDIGNSRKNVINLIQACIINEVDLILAGVKSSGKYGDRVIKLINETESVKYLGKISESDKVRLMSESKVFCLPSTMEGVGISGLEAISFGCNLVITKNGGVSDYFKNNTWFIDPSSIKDISRGLKLALAEKFSNIVTSELDFVRIGYEMRTFYEEIINE